MRDSARALPPAALAAFIAGFLIIRAFLFAFTTAGEFALYRDYAIGVRLHELMSDAALITDSITADQPIFRDGPEKHLWEQTWSAALPRAAETGVVAKERVEALLAGAEQHTASPEVWVAAAQMFAVVGRRPA